MPDSEDLSPNIDPRLQRLIDMAVTDLHIRMTNADPAAERITGSGAAESGDKASSPEIEVLSAETRVWPNSALGCVRPGMQYLQVPVDGSLVRLRIGRKIYRYHSGGSKKPFLCE